MTDLERQLQGELFREFARHWRNEILENATARAASHPKRSMLSWLWPSPIAWGALAAIWMLLFVLDGIDLPASRPSAMAGRALDSVLFAFQSAADIDRFLGIR